MKKKIVGLRELDAFSRAISKFVEENSKLRKAVDAAYLVVAANQAGGNLDAALATGIAVGAEAPKAFAALIDELEPTARAFLGEGRKACESPMEYCSRLLAMTELDMFQAQARNGITFLPGRN